MPNFAAASTAQLGRRRAFSFSISEGLEKQLACFCLLVMALCGVSAAARAQTAHFSGVVRGLGSGFSYPEGAAVDGNGNVFVADTYNDAVKEIVAVGGVIPSNPTINTLGSGFSNPEGVAVDGSGNVFVADNGHNAVKEIVAVGGIVPSNPTIHTLGSGFSNPEGVAVDGSGNVFVADNGHNAVKEIVAVGGIVPSNPTINTLGTGFSGPFGMAVDGSGNVFVADFGNNAVKEIVAVSGVVPANPTINTLGTGFSGPTGVAVDGSGNVFVADNGNNAVKEIMAVGGVVPANPTINTLGSGFIGPFSVAVDGSGNVFIADFGNPAVNEIEPSSANFGSVAVATTTPTLETLTFTFDTGGTLSVSSVLTLGAESLDFTDNGTGTCRTNGPSHAYSAGDTCTVDVSFTPTYPGQRLGAVVLNNSSGNPIATGNLHGIGTGPQVGFLPGVVSTLGSGFSNPFGVAVDGSGNVFVADYGNSAMKEIVAVGGVIPANPTINTLGSGFVNPIGVAVDGSGNVFVGDSGNNAVKEIVAVGGVIPANPTINTLGSGFGNPRGVAVDGSGNVFVADYANSLVHEIDRADAPTLSFASTAVSSTSTDSPRTVTMENTGNAPLTFSVPAIGLNPSISANFTLGNSSTCPQISSSGSAGTLAAGASCTDVISFAPTAVGALTGGLVTTDDALNATAPNYATQTVSLSGTGIDVATQVVLSGLPGSLVAGGNIGSISAMLEDANYSTVTSSTATVTATITGPNGYSKTVTANAVNGVATLDLSSFKLTMSGSYHVHASSTGLDPYAITVRVHPGPASQLALSVLAPTLASGGNLGQVTVTVEDVFGNPVDTPTDVTLTITGPNGYSQTLTGRQADGPASFDLSSYPLIRAGTYTVTTSSSGLPSANSPVTVTAGPASQLAVTAVPTMLVSGGNLGTLTATLEDANGNTVTSSTGPVTATITGPNGYLQSVTANAVSGIANLNLSSLALTSVGTYTLTVTGAGVVSPSTAITVASAPQPAPIPTLPNVTYGAGPTPLPPTTSAGLPITYTVTGPATLNGSSLVITGAGTVTVTATQAGDATHSPVTQTRSFTVAKAASTATLASSGVAASGSSVTLTMQVASAAGIPTGTVTFYDGSTILGTAMVSSTGFATFTVPPLSAGAHSLSAAYSGDENFLAYTSALAVTAVQDFGIAPTGGTLSVPVVPGAAASFTLALTPGPAGFSNAITLTATGLPAGATYSFSPATVTPGSAVANTVLTVQTTKAVATARNFKEAAGIAFAMLFLPFGVSRKGREALKKTRLLSVLGVLLLLGGAAGLTGCGSSNGFFGQRQQSYTTTVTGTSGTLAHATTVVLNVQ